MNDAPIVCTLTDTELRTRRELVLREAAKSLLGVEELENGFRYLFPAEDRILQDLAHIINLERKCCRFLDFKLVVDGQSRHFALEMTGRDGAKKGIKTLFNWN